MTIENNSVDCVSLSPAIGSKVRGLQLDQPLGVTTLANFKAAFHRHHVLVIHDQELTPAQQVAFAE